MSFHMPSHSFPAQILLDLPAERKCLFLQQEMNIPVNYGATDQYQDTEEIEDIGISCPVNSDIGSPINLSFTLDTAASDSHKASSSHCQVSAYRFYKKKLFCYYVYQLVQQWYVVLQEYFDLEKLKTELRHVQVIFAIAQTETVEASRKVFSKHMALNLSDDTNV